MVKCSIEENERGFGPINPSCQGVCGMFQSEHKVEEEVGEQSGVIDPSTRGRTILNQFHWSGAGRCLSL